MDKRVFPVLLSLICSSVLSSTDLNQDYENRLSGAEERVLELISDLLDNPIPQEDIRIEESEEEFSDANIPMLNNILSSDHDEEMIGSDARLFLKSLANNGRAYNFKRDGSIDCLDGSCEDIERRRQPNRNAHYRTLPFGKRVQRQTLRNTRRESKKKPRLGRQPKDVLPFGK